MNSDNKNLSIAVVSFMFFPLIIGTIGLAISGMSFSDSLFTALTMYFINYSDTPPNWLVEVARWVAPVCTISGVSIFITETSRHFLSWILSLFSDTIAVYADDDIYSEMTQNGIGHLIRGNESFLKAKKYLLLNSEQENIRFYLQNREKLRNMPVYLGCESIRSQENSIDNVNLISLEELAARLYWNTNSLYECFTEGKNHFTVSIIGFDKMGQELLLWGLQKNIFSPDQHIEYHIFGEQGDFLNIYHELDQIQDPVIFHNDGWEKNLPILDQSDRIILCGQQSQLETIQNILFSSNKFPLHVFLGTREAEDMIPDNNRCVYFNWKQKVCTKEVLFEEKTLELAKRINLRYAHLYSGVEETEDNAEAEWGRLDAFTRYSNISAADYHEIRKKMLLSWGITNFDELSPEQLDYLAELEHERWCRFHIVNNWKYAPAKDGKRKSAANRTHADLIPYRELTEEEKQKDRETIKTMMEL